MYWNYKCVRYTCVNETNKTHRVEYVRNNCLLIFSRIVPIIMVIFFSYVFCTWERTRFCYCACGFSTQKYCSDRRRCPLTNFSLVGTADGAFSDIPRSIRNCWKNGNYLKCERFLLYSNFFVVVNFVRNNRMFTGRLLIVCKFNFTNYV